MDCMGGLIAMHRTARISWLCHSCSRILKSPCISPFEGPWALKWDRTTHKNVTLIEVDKNTNSALLNCWHCTGRIRQRILTTGDRQRGTVLLRTDWLCHGWPGLDPYRIVETEERGTKSMSRPTTLEHKIWDCHMVKNTSFIYHVFLIYYVLKSNIFIYNLTVWDIITSHSIHLLKVKKKREKNRNKKNTLILTSLK